MFSERPLPDDVAAVRREHAPGALVLDSGRDFETLPPEHRDDLALLTDDIHPHGYDPDWLTDRSARMLHRLTGHDLVVGMPGDGSVAWTTQTTPPVVFVKPRVAGSPDEFVDFLVAEALVEVGLDLPEHFLGFFRDQYADLEAAIPLGPNDVYQVAAALTDAYRGLHTREVFEAWDDDHPRLHAAWADAGERFEPRVAGLPEAMAQGRTDFGDATELACSAIKHGLDLPAPFDALDTLAYRDHGPAFAVKWAAKVFD
ncbi:hypothetical protein ACFQH6_00560 [Halobacteriaceae archaeon GCM10025711]